jgi:curved DNA-binding protein
MTHYEKLGVGESASQDEIKKAYRKLASQHHPDKGGDTAKFQEIEAAYRTLSDPAQREQYDHQRRNPGGNFHFNGPDMHGGMPGGMEDLFRNFGFNFNGHDPFAQFRQHQQPRRNKDLQVQVPISLAETVNDKSITLSVQTTKGTRENVEITIPRGATHGTQIKYPNLGDNFFDGLARGDLYVQVVLHPHPNFEVHNDVDVVMMHSIDCLTAMTGGDIEVTNFEGTKLVVRVPAGIQPGQTLRVKDQGIWVIHGSTRGNLLVKIQITVPKNLSAEQLELVNKIKSTL